MKLSHPYCENTNCRTCYNEHMELMLRLEELTDDDTVDHLGKYRSWLEKDGGNFETEWGWATPDVFEENKIMAYVKDFTEEQ